MSQFWSILKDSFREARDGKIIYVMLFFSVLLTLLAFSISFRPLPLQEAVEEQLSLINMLMRLARQPGAPVPPRFGIENFRQTNDASEPWKGDYEWDLVLGWDNATDKETAKSNPGFTLDRDMVKEMYSHDKFYFLKNVSVDQSASPTEVRYHVTSHGTRIDSAQAWPHEIKILFGLLPFGFVGGTGGSVNEAVYNIEKWGIQQFGAWITMLVAVVMTAFFIPNMLRKGAIDLLIAKPIRRTTLLIYKYIGGLIYMFILCSITVLGIWLALGVRSGMWGIGFLFVIPSLMFYFAILYAVSTLAGTLTRSPIVSILVTCLAWGIFFANGFVHTRLENARQEIQRINPSAAKDGRDLFQEVPGVPKWAVVASDVVNWILPRTYEVDELNSYLIAKSVLSKPEMERKGFHEERRAPWLEVLGVSAAFIAVFLALACWRMIRFDF
jgi:ABC-type transport system involved in multi-copper enzyme maturation permease subunit